MNPTQELIAEHNAVLVALQIIENVEAVLKVNDERALQHIDHLLDFVKGFVDRCHHSKEEEFLFPELERRGTKRLVARSVSTRRDTRAPMPSSELDTGKRKATTQHLVSDRGLVRRSGR